MVEIGDVLIWILGIAGTIVAGTVIYMGKVISDLPNAFVPRSQIDKRFRDLEERMHADSEHLYESMQHTERRTDRQLDKLDVKLDQAHAKLDLMFEKISSKADAWRPGDQERRKGR